MTVKEVLSLKSMIPIVSMDMIEDQEIDLEEEDSESENENSENCELCSLCTDCVDCKNCFDCNDCINCESCQECKDCIGISNAIGLEFVAFGVQLTQKQFLQVRKNLGLASEPKRHLGMTTTEALKFIYNSFVSR